MNVFDELISISEAALSVISEDGVREHLLSYVMGAELISRLKAFETKMKESNHEIFISSGNIFGKNSCRSGITCRCMHCGREIKSPAASAKKESKT
jgi:hypothetical protein